MIHHWCIVIEHQILPICTKTCDGLSISIYQIVGISIHRSLATVHATFILQNSIIRSTCYVTLLPCTLPAIRKIIINLCLPHLTLFGGNEDNTIGSTCTINSSGCSIFQYFDRFDIIRIHKVKATSDRHTVHDIKRITIINSTDTTYTYARRITRLS